MIYLHIPFCRSFCSYCGFYSEALCRRDEEEVFEHYSYLLRKEVEERKEEISKTIKVNTLYIGGGTPSVLSLAVLEGMVTTLKDFGPYKEFTMEVNPEDIVEKGDTYLKGLLGLGINRISMGVQSLDESILRWMNRRHSAEGARKAFSLLRKAGFGNISVDVIFGIAGLSSDTLKSTVSEICRWEPEHISAYQLSLDPGSALSEKAAKGCYTELSEETCAEQYSLICSALHAAGYEHYEISNWARPGFRAVHNSAYWQRLPYAGLGAGAHSFDGANVRSWNSPDYRSWTRESETLGPEEIREERIMLGMRTSDGIPTNLLKNSDLQRLISENSLIPTKEDGKVRIPEEKFFVSDEIIRELF